MSIFSRLFRKQKAKFVEVKNIRKGDTFISESFYIYKAVNDPIDMGNQWFQIDVEISTRNVKSESPEASFWSSNEMVILVE